MMSPPAHPQARMVDDVIGASAGAGGAVQVTSTPPFPIGVATTLVGAGRKVGVTKADGAEAGPRKALLFALPVIEYCRTFCSPGIMALRRPPVVAPLPSLWGASTKYDLTAAPPSDACAYRY